MTNTLDEDRVREIIRGELEAVIEAHGWPDAMVHQALLELAKEHLWKQGLFARLKFWANFIGFLGIIGGAIAMIATFFGLEIARK